jgi:integrase
VVDLQATINQWHNDLASGAIYGRRLSERTQKLHRHNLKPILSFLRDKPLNNKSVIHAFVSAQSCCKPKEDAKRKHQYDALISFLKSLIFHGLLDESILAEIKKYKPRRFFPPKKTLARDREIQILTSTIEKTKGSSKYEKAFLNVLVVFVYNTGLRCQEICDLEQNHIDFDRRELTVFHGKGNKTRRIGLNKEAYKALTDYLWIRPKSQSKKFFLLSNGKAISCDTLVQRFSRLAKRAGLDLSLHSLRRGFATKNAEAGRPLVMIQQALGHSSPVTTSQSYLMPEIESGIRSMQSW